ncbi:DUF3311 domain-containing protein [Streptomyces sp. RB6PN25]|uniref:DUF3311 domain-containing protein n=1 Tax=Streptomyces humicola TaxID=2953240 RepID=A0ABT1PRJ8_9ACTN|nr:DUF3311 domain-containing protein [Streptomyces humicola]
MTVQSEPQPSQARRVPVVTGARVGAAVCLILPLVSMLWVNSYARLKPTFIGIPFFYWYQISWVLITCALTAVAYVLIRRDERARRGQDEAQGGAA